MSRFERDLALLEGGQILSIIITSKQISERQALKGVTPLKQISQGMIPSRGRQAPESIFGEKDQFGKLGGFGCPPFT